MTTRTTAEAAQLTGCTLRPVPRSFMADSAGRVCVLVQVNERPSGRALVRRSAGRPVHRRGRPGAQRRAVRRQPSLFHRALRLGAGV